MPFSFLLTLLCISGVTLSRVHPDRRARVLSILTTGNNTSVPVYPAQTEDTKDIVIEMDNVPETFLQELKLCYRDTPRGIVAVVWITIIFMIGCLLILFLLK